MRLAVLVVSEELAQELAQAVAVAKAVAVAASRLSTQLPIPSRRPLVALAQQAARHLAQQAVLLAQVIQIASVSRKYHARQIWPHNHAKR